MQGKKTKISNEYLHISEDINHVSSDIWRSFLDRWQPPEQVVLILSALFIGLGTGLGAVFFVWSLKKMGELSKIIQNTLGNYLGIILFMGLAGLIVGFVIEKWAKEAKGHGVPEVMEAISLKGGRIRPRVAALKVLASSLTIGTGGSAGREGPIVQVGSALGSTLGQVFHFSNDRIRILVSCGAAAGIAATFNAPIAGTIFALEVILGRFTMRYFGSVVISSVAAGIVGRMFLGDKPAFNVPSYTLSHLGELPIYVFLGIISAFVAVLFIRTLYGLENLFDNWKIPLAIKTSIGLVLCALVSFLLPEKSVLGPGLDLIGEAIADDFNMSIGLMAALLFLKMAATGFTLGSGNSGGVFAPALFMGAVLGGIVGSVSHTLFPGIVVHPGAYAIVGMAAVFSSAAHAPITGVLIVFEMSNDYRLIFPLMIATVLATLLAEHLLPESIYTLKLKQKGITLQSGRDEDMLQGVSVEEVMTRDVETLSADMSLGEAAEIFTKTRHHGMPIIDSEGKLWGMITLSDVDRAISNHVPFDVNIAEIGIRYSRLLIAFPDETMGEALARMSTRGIGRLPVVSRIDRYELLGMIRRQDIIRAYQLGLTRRAELQHRTKQLKTRNLDKTEFVEIYLDSKSRAIGKTVKNVAENLPTECVLVSIRRGGKVLIPHGDTILKLGDQITAFVESSFVDSLNNCFGISPEPDSSFEKQVEKIAETESEKP